MADYQTKYLFCVTFDEQTNQSLAKLSADMRSVYFSRLSPNLPHHMTLVPPFKVHRDSEELVNDAANYILLKSPRPYVETTNLDVFVGKNASASHIILSIKKTETIDMLHRNLLGLVRTYRERNIENPNEINMPYGSEFVLSNYHPHITLGELTADKVDAAKTLIGDTYYREYRDTHLSIFAKRALTNSKWSLVNQIPISRR